VALNWKCDLCGHFVSDVVRIFKHGKLIEFSASCSVCDKIACLRGRLVITNPRLLKAWGMDLLACRGYNVSLDDYPIPKTGQYSEPYRKQLRRRMKGKPTGAGLRVKKKEQTCTG